MSELEELRRKVQEKEEKEKEEQEVRKLKEKLGEGTLRSIIKKGLKKGFHELLKK